MNKLLTLQQIADKADQVLKLRTIMDETFKPGQPTEHLKIAICAGISDAISEAYREGYNQALMDKQVNG